MTTPIARFPDPNAIKMPDGKAPPWLCVMQYGQGRTAWIGSPQEIVYRRDARLPTSNSCPAEAISCYVITLTWN